MNAIIGDLTLFSSGFCDRLWLVTFCVAVAKLKGISSLFIKESPNLYCPYNFCDLLTVRNFDVRPLTKENDETHSYESYNHTKAPYFPHVSFVKPNDLKIHAVEFLGLWLSAYKELRPKDTTRGIIDSLAIDRAETLGVHIRKTDKVNDHPNHWEMHPNDLPQAEKQLCRWVKKMASKLKTKRIFLATDNKASKDFYAEKFSSGGFEVLAHNASFDDRSLRQTSGEDFLVDLFALSQCGMAVGLINSNVLLTADRIGDFSSFCFCDESGKQRLVRSLIRHKFFRYLQFLYKTPLRMHLSQAFS